MNFAQPGWLALLILLPLFAGIAVLRVRLRRRIWADFAAPRLRPALLKRSNPLPHWLALIFLLAASASAIVALARPRGDAGTRTEKTLGRNVMIALDISKSMRVSDVKPDRLTQAKVVIYELLEALPNERIGFLGFAGNPHLYAPLTIDHSAVRETIEQIDETWAPLGGSDLAAAVHLATETLKKTGQKNNALVIVSDGEKHDGDLDAMIAEAEQSGIYIIAIGVGTEDGGPVPNPKATSGQMVDRAGRPIISRLQSDVMRKLAEETKGRYAVAGSGLDIPALVKSVVSDLDTFQMDGRERRISIEFYQWLMFPAIVLLGISIVAGTRWKGIRATLLVMGAILTTPTAPAGEASAAKAALAGKNNEQARDAYHQLAGGTRSHEARARYRFGEAIAAYRAEDFRSARTAFSQSLSSEDSKVRASAHLGMGNCLFQLGWKGISGESYPADPAAVPNLDRFDTLVKEALAKLRESDAPEDGETGGYVRMESVITNWADSVRHYDSGSDLFPSDRSALKNRELTVTYLKRLAELLDQEKQDSEQAMPQQQPGQGKGDGKPKEGSEGDEGEPNSGENGDSEKDGRGDNGEKKKDGKNGKDDKDKGKDKNKGDGDPNESPEERARRILKENADLEKGPLSPGRREFQDAEKDW